MAEEKRRFSRVVFNVDARLIVDGTTYAVDRVVNLSVGGCLLGLAGEFAVDSECTFLILLPRMAPGVEVFGRIVRVEKGEVSLQFNKIDPENLFHLHNIVRYNAEDPDVIEEEINSRKGLK